MIATTQGRLSLCFEASNNEVRTRLRVTEQRPPLKVVRAFEQPDGAALVHLHNVSGGILSGDDLETHIHVGPGARAQVTSTGATRIYRQPNAGRTSIQTIRVEVNEGGLIEYVPDPLIPYAGSRYAQDTHINLGADAGLFWWEIVAPGREAHGETFAYDLLELKVDISADGMPIAAEHIRLEPRARSMQSRTRLGRNLYYASFYMLRIGCDALALESRLYDWLATQAEIPEATWGVSALAAHGVCVRGISTTGHPLAHGLQAFWRAGKLALYGREPHLPRKLY